MPSSVQVRLQCGEVTSLSVFTFSAPDKPPQLLSAFQLSPNTVIVNIASLTSNLTSCAYHFSPTSDTVLSPGCPEVAVLQLPEPAPPHCLEVKNLGGWWCYAGYKDQDLLLLCWWNLVNYFCKLL